jgi:AcrR family transcriptional regulator
VAARPAAKALAGGGRDDSGAGRDDGGLAVSGGDGSFRQPGRPRSDRVHQAILDATLALLRETGFSGLAIENVATRAGVGKATIYRRWPSKVPLVIEAMQRIPAIPAPDTGSIARDLTELLRASIDVLRSTPLAHVLPSLVGERHRDAELSDALDGFLAERRRPLLRMLERAVERGELPRGADLELGVDLILGPFVVRLFFTAGPVDPDLVPPIVDAVIRGLGGVAPPKP